MLLAAGHSWRQESGFGRWSGALAAILLLHAGAAVGSMIVWDSVEPPAPPPAAIMLELAPLAAAPPAPEMTAPPEPTPPPKPEPPVDLNQMLLPIPELPLTPPDIPPPEVELPKPEPEKKKVAEAKPEKPKEKPKKEEAPKPKPKPKPEPEPEVVQKPTPPAPRQEAAAALVQPSTAPAAPSAAEVARRTAAEANWQGILLAHLQQHKKYPRLARKRHEEGTAFLRFRMDRSGKVLSYALERSAGYEALDEEVLAMIERAQPLPALPAEVTEASIEIVVPVQFTLN